MIWLLLVIFQFKHLLADYILQGSYMLGKFRDKGWVLPLAAHCGVHWLFTFWIVGFALPGYIDYTTGVWMLFGLPTLDFVIHFIMDRIKASPKMLGRYTALSKNEMITLLQQEAFTKMLLDPKTVTPEIILVHGNDLEKINSKKESNILFWWSLGLDQMIHHLTDILLIYFIMSV